MAFYHILHGVKCDKTPRNMRFEDLLDSRKGAEWKVATARFFRERYLAPHRWIAERLNMGVAGSVQSLISKHWHKSETQDASWKILNKNYEIVDWCLYGFLWLSGTSVVLGVCLKLASCGSNLEK